MGKNVLVSTNRLGNILFSLQRRTVMKDFFSMVNRNTGALYRNIKVKTIERKVVIGNAIQRHGYIFHYKNGNIGSSDDDE